ncbi:MAG: TIGR00730 family Rossman fold protein, partial [bacterium]|nr:TIGR00730 family Rossman fold protein [bacterium]
MNNIKRICVFASASNDLDNLYYEAAAKMGEVIAKNGYDLVYGGSHRGSMYAAAKAAKDNGSKVYAVMPEIFANREGFANPEDCKEFIITKGMRERKAKLDEISDAVIAVAGGFGTLE